MAAAQASRVASSSNSTSRVCSPSTRFPLSKLSWQETGRAVAGRGVQQPPETGPEPEPEPKPEPELEPKLVPELETEPVIILIKLQRDLRPKLEPEPEPEPGPDSKLEAERHRPALPPGPGSAGVVAAAAAKPAAKAAACSALVGSSRPSAAEPSPASGVSPEAGATP